MTPIKCPSKRISYLSDAIALCCVDFPIYYIESISERHFVIAGGGGSSKTGVHNQINILEIVPTHESCAAELITKYQTPNEVKDAIMSGALLKDDAMTNMRFVTSGGEKAIVFNLKLDIVDKIYKVAGYECFGDPSAKADIKSIKYSPKGRIFTGYFDGQLTAWGTDKWSIDNRLTGTSGDNSKFHPHSKEIDEIDVDPTSDQLLTLSRGEGRFLIRDLNSLKIVQEFKRDFINEKSTSQITNVNYSYRSCRFAYDTTNPNATESCLLVACNPIPARGPSLVHKWSTRGGEFKRLASRSVTTDGIMAVDVSKDGQHFAIGTRSGGVVIFKVRNLSQLYKLDNAHHNAVTGLEFLPLSRETLLLTNCHMCPLLSVSIDRQVVLHRPKRYSFIVNSFKYLIGALVTYLSFSFMVEQDFYSIVDLI